MLQLFKINKKEKNIKGSFEDIRKKLKHTYIASECKFDFKGNIYKLKIKSQYQPLRDVLDRAFEQASSGKGKERHATNEPFEKQLICEISRRLHSFDGNIFQATKKMIESKRLFQMKEKDRAVNEILGAINYMAAAIILIEENFDKEEWY